MKHAGKRLLALLLALIMAVGLLPLLELDGSAIFTGGTQPRGSTSQTTIGTRDLTDVVSLPITVRDYDNDGMLFEFAQYNGSSDGLSQTVTDDYITLPSPHTGYNMTALEKFGGSKSMVAADMAYGDGTSNTNSNYINNGTIQYHFGIPYNARYATISGSDTAGGYGFGVRALIRQPSSTVTNYPRYAVVRYRVVTDDNNDGVNIGFLHMSGTGGAQNISGNLYASVFDGKATEADNTQILQLIEETDGWRTVVVDLYESSVTSRTYTYNGTTSTYNSYANKLNAASTIGSSFLCLDYGKQDVIDVSCVAFFSALDDSDNDFSNDVRHFLYQDVCYRTGKTMISAATEEHTYTVGKPAMTGASVMLDISGGQPVYANLGGSETIATAVVAEGYSELGDAGQLANHARYLSITDTGRGYGIGFRAVLMNGMNVTMSNMRYVAVRYRISDPGRSTAASIPFYMVAETGGYGDTNKNYPSFTDGHFSNQASTLSRFNALTDGQWHTAIVDFGKYTSQYPTGEAYYYHSYNGSDTVYRLGIADFYGVYGNTIQLAYVHCFNTAANAQAFADAYDLWAANEYETETITEQVPVAAYTAQAGNSEARTYANGNNVSFGFLHGSQNLSSSYANYYSTAQIANSSSKFTKWGDDAAGSISCGNIIGTAASHRLYTMGLVKDALGDNGPEYQPEAVSYLADLLQKTLNVPKSFVKSSTLYYSYNYVAGEPDGARYGYYDSAEQFPRDLAGWLRWKLGLTNADGSLTGSNGAANLGTIALTEAHKGELTGAWNDCKDHIGTFTDAAYYMLNNLFADGGLGRDVPEYEYLQLSTETRTGGATAYTFDASYGNVFYDYEDGVIGNHGTEPSAESNPSNADKNIKYYFTSGSDTTTRYPFVPILPDMPSYKHTDSPYFKDPGVASATEDTNSYVNRDYNFVAECHGHFLYEEARDLYFAFEGDDDVYLFVNGQLVMDIGGAHSIADQKILLNDYVSAAHTKVANGTATDRDRALALEDGTNYRFDFYYMERHGYGANLQITTNIRVYNENITVEKSATQNGVALEDYGVAQFGSELSYSFSITNNSDDNSKPLINYQFNDKQLGFYAGYDMACDGFDADPTGSPLGSYGGANRVPTDLTVTVTNKNGAVVKQWNHALSVAQGDQTLDLSNFYALRDLLDDLTYNDIPIYGGANHSDGANFEVEQDGTFYLKLESPNWFVSGEPNGAIRMYAWGKKKDGTTDQNGWFTFTQTVDLNTGEPVEGVYETKLDAGIWEGCILVRLDKDTPQTYYFTAGSGDTHDHYWNRTGNIYFKDGKNCLEGFAYQDGSWDGSDNDHCNVKDVSMGVYQPNRRGLYPGETLTISGVKAVIPAATTGVYTNTVTVKAGINPGAATFHLVGRAGAPEYYAAVGQTLTVPLRTLLREGGYPGWDMSQLYRCTVTGFRQNSSSGEIVIDKTNNNLILNFTSPGVKQLYFTYEGNTSADKIHATVYVYEAADSTYVLDFDGNVNLGNGSDEPFTANDTLSLNGVSTNVTHEVVSDVRPTYDTASNTLSYPVSGIDLWALREPTGSEAPPAPQYSVTVTAPASNVTVTGSTSQTVTENSAMTTVTVMPNDPIRYAIPAPTITGGDVTATFTSSPDVLYFNLSGISYWRDALAVQSAYFYGGGLSDHWEKLVPVTNTIYACKRPAGYTNIILVRHDPESYDSDPNWGSAWSQSADLTLPTVSGQNYLDAFRDTSNNGANEHWTVYSGTTTFGGYTITGAHIKATTTVSFPAAVERLNSFPITKGAYNNATNGSGGTLGNGTSGNGLSLSDEYSRTYTTQYLERSFSYVVKVYAFDSSHQLLAVCSNDSEYNAVKSNTAFFVSAQGNYPQLSILNGLMSTGTPYVTYNMGNEGKGYTTGNILVWSGNPMSVGQMVSASVSDGSTLSYDMTTDPQGHLNNNASPAVGTDLNNTVSVSYESTESGFVRMHDTGADWWCGFGGSARIWNSDTAVSASDIRYVAIKYRSNSSDNFYLFASTDNTGGNVAYTDRGKVAASKITPEHVNDWETVVLDLFLAANNQVHFPCYGNTSYDYGKTFSSANYSPKSLFFGLESGKSGIHRNTTATGGGTVDVAYIAFFADEDDAIAYNEAHNPVLVGTSGPKYYQNGAEATLGSGMTSLSYATTNGSFSATLSATANTTPALSFAPSGFLSGVNTIYLTSRVRSTADVSPAYLGDVDPHTEVELTQAVTVVPANVVYYDDHNAGIHYNTTGTVHPTVTWTGSGTNTQTADQSGPYGGDPAYAASANHYSGAGEAKIEFTGNMALADFDFTGTGFDLFARCDNTGASVQLRIFAYSAVGDYSGTPLRTIPISTEFHNNSYTGEGDEAMYQVPVASVSGLTRGTYHVIIDGIGAVDMTGWKVEKDETDYYMVRLSDGERWKMIFGNPTMYQHESDDPTPVSPAAVKSTFYLDGLRVYNTLGSEDQTDYYNPGEANASFIEVRDLLLTGGRATAVNYQGDKAGFTNFTTTVELRNAASEGFALTDATLADFSYYFLVGPKNELYLNGAQKQALVFQVVPDGDSDRTLQIAAKLLDSASYGGTGPGKLYYRIKNGWKPLNENIQSGTELYYTIDPTLCPQQDGAYLVIIAAGTKNEDNLEAGGRYLSLTKLKYKGWRFVESVFSNTTNFVYENGDPNGRIIGVTSSGQRTLRRVLKLMSSDEVIVVPPVGPVRPDEPQPENCADGHSFEFGVCTVCGAVTDAVRGSSISLHGEIGVNIYLTLADPADSTVTVNGEVRPVERCVLADGVEAWRCSYPVSAKDMHKDVTVRLTVDGEPRLLQIGSGEDSFCESWTTSVQSYLDQLADGGDSTLTALIRATSNYGHYAQLQFESTDALTPVYEDEALALSGCTAELLEPYAPTVEGSVNGAEYLGATLLLKGATQIRFYFRLDDGVTPEQYSITVDGQPAALTQHEDGRWYVTVENISAKLLNHSFTLRMEQGGSSLALHYAALSYCREALATCTPGDKLLDTVRSLYVYWKTADAYFNPKGGDTQ